MKKFLLSIMVFAPVATPQVAKADIASYLLAGCSGVAAYKCLKLYAKAWQKTGIKGRIGFAVPCVGGAVGAGLMSYVFIAEADSGIRWHDNGEILIAAALVASAVSAHLIDDIIPWNGQEQAADETETDEQDTTPIKHKSVTKK